MCTCFHLFDRNYADVHDGYSFIAEVRHMAMYCTFYLSYRRLVAGRTCLQCVTMELRLSCANSSTCWLLYYVNLLPFIGQQLCRCPWYTWYIYIYIHLLPKSDMWQCIFFSLFTAIIVSIYLIDGLVQERHVSSASAVGLGLSCANPSICWLLYYMHLLPFI